jgi:ATP-dependent Lon protease
LEQEIAKICRKAVKELLLSANLGTKKSQTTKVSASKAKVLKKINVTSKNLEQYLGVYRYDYGVAAKENQVGQVTGLAWTSVGGELLTIEAALLPGKGKTITTGKLGDVMQESVQAAMSVVRSRATRLGIAEDFYEKKDIHIHLPEGATPKDGPSAGIGLTTALVSVLTGIPARSDVAMTGEITLRGEVLAIGGLKEKLLAAHRGGIKIVLIPESNVKDLVDIPENIKNQLQIHPVKWIDQVLELALESAPKALQEKGIEIVPEVVSETVADIKLTITH